MMKTYFSIEPTDAGFTDQLVQFNALYKLGLHLGFHYIHAPLSSQRSNAGYLLVGDIPRDISAGSRIVKWLRRTWLGRKASAPDIYEFLGINRHFQARVQPTVAECAAMRSMTIALSDRHLAELKIDSLESLAEYIADIAAPSGDDPDAATTGHALVRFRLDGPRRIFFSMIQERIPRFQDGLDLPGIYLEARAREPIRSLYGRRGLKILMHIRQGDTAVVETPWNTYLPVWSLRQDQLKEYDSFDQIESADRLFQVSDYKVFLDGFLDRLGQSPRDVLVFSDGANRSLRIVERSLDKLAWSPDRVDSFRKSKLDYDARQFSCFSAVENLRLCVGEEPMKLRQLINSAIESDIVIVSNQLRMIPKLVANFCGENAPKVIVLYKNSVPVNSDIISNPDARFIYVDIDKPDFDSLMARLRGQAGR